MSTEIVPLPDRFRTPREPIEPIVDDHRQDWTPQGFEIRTHGRGLGPDRRDDHGAMIYDPTNGVTSRGDIVGLLRIP